MKTQENDKFESLSRTEPVRKRRSKAGSKRRLAGIRKQLQWLDYVPTILPGGRFVFVAYRPVIELHKTVFSSYDDLWTRFDRLRNHIGLYQQTLLNVTERLMADSVLILKRVEEIPSRRG